MSQSIRFNFGANWSHFLGTIDDERIRSARSYMSDMLGENALHGASFLDAGCGSGLSSLAARQLGATVCSFDFDQGCVACTQDLRSWIMPDDPGWNILNGSVLDRGFLSSLGRFDVVHCWGVLHHTGAMWDGLGKLVEAVAPGGRLLIALYDDRGWRSRVWRVIKRIYNSLPTAVRPAAVVAVMLPVEAEVFVRTLLRGRLAEHLRHRRQYGAKRGMSLWHDWVDWVGGYPFEVAKPNAVTAFVEARGLMLQRYVAGGCNQFVFRAPGPPPRG